MGSYTLLAFLAPGVISIYNISIPHPWLQRAIGLLLAGIGAAIGLVVPQGGFAYHKAMLHNLSVTLPTLARSTGNALSRLSTSLNSLANVVMMGYLLA